MCQSYIVAAACRVSLSADKSFLQKEYTSIFKGMCSEVGVDSPFELDTQLMNDFFSGISVRWKKRKAQLYTDGKITADQL